MTSELVSGAIDAIKAGDKKRARKLLIEAIKLNSQDADAWYVLAAAVPEVEQKIDCLERTLKINPQHEKAKRALAKITSPPAKTLPRNKLLLGGALAVIAILMTCACGLIIRGIIKILDSPTQTPVPRSEVQIPTNIPTITPTEEQPTPTHTAISPTHTTVPTEIIGSIQAVYPCIPSSLPISGEVIEVVDGDTIHVLIGGQEFSVRYIGIDTPEINESFGQQAYQYNHSLVYGKKVGLYFDVSETDKYGRLLHYVFVGDTFVNYEMVLKGYAIAKDYPPDTACSDILHQAQDAAAAAKAGIWQPAPSGDRSIEVVPIATSPPGASSPAVTGCTCQFPDLDCADFGTHNTAQACYEYCLSIGRGDYYNLDGDHDGSACESLP